MTLLLAILFLFQTALRNDVAELRSYLGLNYASVVAQLNQKNQILLRNTERLAPAQAAEMRARWKVPATLDRQIFTATINNVGQGLLSFLFEDDFIAEQANFVFCPPQQEVTVDGVTIPARSERVMALQILFDDSRAVGGTVPQILQNVYKLPPPVASPDYQRSLAYPFRQGVPVTIWDLVTVEILHQPISGAGVITGQLWLTEKNIVRTCVNLPRITP